MDWIRYGFGHLTLVAGTTFLAAMAVAAALALPMDIYVLLVVALTALTAVAVDLLLTPTRVIRDFRKGRFTAALRGTRFLRRLTFKSSRRAALKLNLAACHLAQGNYGQGGEALQEVDRKVLPATLKGIWENNYAYYLLGAGGDPAEALRICDEALGLDENNPAFHGTRGMALLALGRLEDAIAELCRSMEQGSLGPSGLAETYFYLGRAWELKGEEAYARDHFLKSVNVAPESPYGRKASEMLKRYLKT